MIPSYPKIFSIGTNYIKDIFNEEVEITEKIDGSMFAFGKIGEELYLRSKGSQLYIDNPEKMFAKAIGYVDQIRNQLTDNIIYYAEYLAKPKHNTLSYNRVPKHNLILFGVMDYTQNIFLDIHSVAQQDVVLSLDIEVVPILFSGKIGSIDILKGFLDKESILGGPKIEGVVVKNYHRNFLLGGRPIPIMAGKCVSETFKEVHRERWGKEEKSEGRLNTFFKSFRTEARWQKAIQHLQERGELEGNPRDIGKLLKEIHCDIESEEKEAVKEFLWNEFKRDLKSASTAGLAEWYKERLLQTLL